MKDLSVQIKSEKFHQYLDSYKGEMKNHKSDGYYHENVVAEAYSAGFNDGKKSGANEFLQKIISNKVEEFTQKANQIYILSKNVIKHLKTTGYEVSSLHINLTPSRPSVIISVPSEILNEDNFINIAYKKVFENKKIYTDLFNDLLDVGLVSSENLNLTLLKEDGFGYIEEY